MFGVVTFEIQVGVGKDIPLAVNSSTRVRRQLLVRGVVVSLPRHNASPSTDVVPNDKVEQTRPAPTVNPD